MPIDRVALIQDLCRLSLQAGAAIMVHYANNVTATKKDDNSPVTIADQDAERIILNGLARVAPGIPVVS